MPSLQTATPTTRQMDGTIAVDDRAAALRVLLPRRAQRVLVVGNDALVPVVEELLGGEGEIAAAAALEDAPGEDWDAVLWRTPHSIEPGAVRAALERARSRLTADGRLAVVAGGGEPEIRAWVRGLSESGFVILKEIALPPSRAVLARRDDYVIRSFETCDEAPIAALFAESFPHARRAPEHWRWKYHDAPWGGPYASLAFSPEGELATHYAGYPMPFWCGGREYLALHMGDTMTAPRFRRVGRGTSSLLGRTVRHFFARHRGGGLGFFYGFNTGAIQRFCGWFIGGSQVEPVAYRELPLAGAAEFSAAGYRVEAADGAGRPWNPRPWDRLFARAAPHYRFLVKRNARYVDWRYLRCPDVDYRVLAVYRHGLLGRRLAGWGVFRRQEDVLLWGDALFDPRHAGGAEALLAAALAVPEFEGVEAIAGWFPERPAWWSAELERLGFESRPHPQDLAFMILPDGEHEPPLGELYYAMGDGDLF